MTCNSIIWAPSYMHSSFHRSTFPSEDKWQSLHPSLGSLEMRKHVIRGLRYHYHQHQYNHHWQRQWFGNKLLPTTCTCEWNTHTHTPREWERRTNVCEMWPSWAHRKTWAVIMRSHHNGASLIFVYVMSAKWSYTHKLHQLVFFSMSVPGLLEFIPLTTFPYLFLLPPLAMIAGKRTQALFICMHLIYFGLGWPRGCHYKCLILMLLALHHSVRDVQKAWKSTRRTTWNH